MGYKRLLKDLLKFLFVYCLFCVIIHIIYINLFVDETIKEKQCFEYEEGDLVEIYRKEFFEIIKEEFYK